MNCGATKYLYASIACVDGGRQHWVTACCRKEDDMILVV